MRHLFYFGINSLLLQATDLSSTYLYLSWVAVRITLEVVAISNKRKGRLLSSGKRMLCNCSFKFDFAKLPASCRCLLDFFLFAPSDELMIRGRSRSFALKCKARKQRGRSPYETKKIFRYIHAPMNAPRACNEGLPSFYSKVLLVNRRQWIATAIVRAEPAGILVGQ